MDLSINVDNSSHLFQVNLYYFIGYCVFELGMLLPLLVFIYVRIFFARRSTRGKWVMEWGR